MSTWTPLDTDEAVESFLDRVGWFHDGCLREVSLVTGSFVDGEGGLHDDGANVTSVVMFIQIQRREPLAIEIHCQGVTLFRVTPTPEGCDSIIATAEFGRKADGARHLGLKCVGANLTGPPNGMVHVRIDEHTPNAVEIEARTMSWRAVSDGTGPAWRYRPATFR